MSDRLSKLRELEALTLASIYDSPPEKRAALVAQYRCVLVEIAELEKSAGEAGDPLDEIAARRAARGVSSSGKGRSVL